MAWLTELKVHDRVCVNGEGSPYTIIRLEKLNQGVDSCVHIWSTFDKRVYVLSRYEEVELSLGTQKFLVKYKGVARRPGAQSNTACMCFIGTGFRYNRLKRKG